MTLEDILVVADSMGLDRAVVVNKLKNKGKETIGDSVYLFDSFKEILGLEFSMFVDEIQKQYVLSSENLDFSYLKRLISMTGISPSDEVIEKFCDNYIGLGDCGMLKKLNVVLDDGLPEKIIQEFYSTILKGTSIDDLKRVSTLLDIKPKFTDSELETAYTYLIRHQQFESVKSLWDLTNVKIDVSDEIVHKAYDNLIKLGSVSYFDAVEIVTGIKPEPKAEDIEQGYDRKLNNYNLHNVDYLLKYIEVVGIMPSNEVVQKAYINLISNERCDALKQLKSITGIKWSDETISAGYSKLLKPESSNFSPSLIFLKKLQNILQVKPSEELIQDAYFSTLKNPNFRAEEYHRFIDTTGFVPKDEDMQEVYDSFFKAGKYNVIKKLFFLTNITPKISEESLRVVYEEKLTGDVLNSLKKLKDFGSVIGISLKPDFVESLYIKAINDGCLYNIDALRCTTGIEPSKKVYEALINSL